LATRTFAYVPCDQAYTLTSDIRYRIFDIMRTLIDIPDHVLKVYDTVAKMKKISRAEVIRQSLERDMARRRQELFEMACGAWKDRPIDGLAHQRKMRNEDWD
jgi:hypothetical protein